MQDGYANVLQASNGKEAVNVYRQHASTVKIVLMDNDMPVMNGIEATKEILALNQNEHSSAGVKIIGVTGNVHEDKLQGCLDAGMFKVQKKPVTMEELSTTMLEAILS
jgi:CheY-like chemotaxis protein